MSMYSARVEEVHTVMSRTHRVFNCIQYSCVCVCVGSVIFGDSMSVVTPECVWP